VRIRTIKPEFWPHETLSRLPDFTRLMAIALLNYADDEGYFYANPVLIRGSLFPFVDESGRIRGAVGELSAIGYLRIGIDNEGREIGHIINFTKHQKGDKLKSSKLKELATFPEQSGTPPRPVPDQSPLDQGSGIRDQGSGDTAKVAAKTSKPSAEDAGWIAQLQSVEAYRHLKVSMELSKAKTWCQTNGRQCTRRFFTNWLNRSASDARVIAVPPPLTEEQKAENRRKAREAEPKCASPSPFEEILRLANEPPPAWGGTEENPLLIE